MTPDDRSSNGRRDFIAQLATAAAAIAATACASSAAATAAASPAPAPAAPAPPTFPPVDWDDSWATRVSAAKHKAVFDAPAIADGMVFVNALVYLESYREMYKTTQGDVVPVLVLRHRAIPLAVDDELWDRYELGDYAKVEDGATGKWARRNPYLRADPADRTAYPPATITALTAAGAVLLGCGLAANALAGHIASRGGMSHAQAFAEVRAHLVPGLTLMPSGIMATTRAQEAGAAFMRSA